MPGTPMPTSDLRLSQGAVLAAFERYGPMTDETLVYIYTRIGSAFFWPEQSPSGLRSRRAELVRLGLLEYTQQKEELDSGRLAKIWGIPEK